MSEDSPRSHRVVRAGDAQTAELALFDVLADVERDVVLRKPVFDALSEADAIREAARQAGYQDGLRARVSLSSDASGDAPAGSRSDDLAVVSVGRALLGRVIDADGMPVDGGPPLPDDLIAWPLDRLPPSPMSRLRVDTTLATGIRVIDALCLLGVGQRIALSAGPGLGKSTLLGQIARQSGAAVNVIALIGERGREVRAFVEDALGRDGLARSVVVVSTADEPAERRIRAGQVATAIAEYFRDERPDDGDVFLFFDSLTRYARALRDRALAHREPPALGGYPARVLTELPRLLERAGNGVRGRMSAVYSLLSVEGDPIESEVASLLDGQIVLSPAVASAGRWPAVDVNRSISRVMAQVAEPAHRQSARRLRAYLALLAERADLVAMGAYRRGTDPELDEALAAQPAMGAFLAQGADQSVSLADTLAHLNRILA